MGVLGLAIITYDSNLAWLTLLVWLVNTASFSTHFALAGRVKMLLMFTAFNLFNASALYHLIGGDAGVTIELFITYLVVGLAFTANAWRIYSACEPIDEASKSTLESLASAFPIFSGLIFAFGAPIEIMHVTWFIGSAQLLLLGLAISNRHLAINSLIALTINITGLMGFCSSSDITMAVLGILPALYLFIQHKQKRDLSYE